MAYRVYWVRFNQYIWPTQKPLSTNFLGEYVRPIYLGTTLLKTHLSIDKYGKIFSSSDL